MRQRVMIAIRSRRSSTLDRRRTDYGARRDDPAQILKLIEQRRRDLNMAVLLVSHDFGVIAQACQRVAVMYRLRGRSRAGR